MDLAPTFLEISGLPKKEWPVLFDGWSLLDQWKHPHQGTGLHAGEGNARETLNIEFWGLCTVEAPSGKELGIPFLNNTYKTVRMLGEQNGWLFTKWCTGETEMYHTDSDKWELHNLAESTDPEHKRVYNRLNAILMVIKSCEQGSCRDPWAVFDLPGREKLRSFTQAMDAQFRSNEQSWVGVEFEDRRWLDRHSVVVTVTKSRKEGHDVGADHSLNVELLLRTRMSISP